jgi:tRNA pseudouridine32 synthase/23S rRNA pseudouridine746 synthase
MPLPAPPPAPPDLRPSVLQLPRGPWWTVLDCLCAHFAAISREEWIGRFERARVLDADRGPLDVQSRYRPGMTVLYYREVAGEVPIPGVEWIVHVDEDLVVVDKPHFLPVVPAGRFVRETLLHRLTRSLGRDDLVPLHRLDRGTAGLVMFSANPTSRAAYHRLFSERRIAKRYEALAPALPEQAFPLTRRSRIGAGEPFFRMRELDGPANSETRIEVIEREPSFWRYGLDPTTGRKHQLRVHMAALGAAILNDGFYPTLADSSDDDFTRPLKLLARSLRFVDPLSGRERHFESRRTL